MTRSQIFDPAVESARRWLVELADNLELRSADDPRTLRSLRAGLHAIRDRLTLHEVIDLGAQLPMLIRGIYYEGFASNHDPTKIRTPAQMLERISAELGSDHRVDAVDVMRGVIHLLVEHVSPGEIRDIMATLPAPIAMMWNDLTGHALVEIEPH